MQNLVIDVSEHQGHIDWEKVKPKIDGAIIRCGYGDDEKSQDDKYWERNVAECERLGIPYGVYLYSYADSDAHAKSEVAHALRLLKGHKPSYPVYIDLEEPKYGSFARRAADIFCKAMKEAGYIPGFYTYQSFYDNYLSGYSTYTLWIASYADPDIGKPTAKPYIKAQYDAWQYTSAAVFPGITENTVDVSYFYKQWTKEADSTQYIDVADVAAAIHADMCNDDANGYSWEPRNGEDGLGIKKLTIGGRVYQYDRGSYDCSSSVITACNEALRYTKYKDALKGATYTGNMLDVFVKSGLFVKWNTETTIAKRGDVYLNYANHTAMCQDDDPDLLSEFSINEKGTTHGGKVGDQTGKEAYIHAYYDYPWNCTLHWKNAKIAAAEQPNGSSSGSSSSSSKPAKLTVDGIMGPLTIKAFQKALGVKQSGKMDKTTVKALQRALNAGKTMR